MKESKGFWTPENVQYILKSAALYLTAVFSEDAAKGTPGLTKSISEWDILSTMYKKDGEGKLKL